MSAASPVERIAAAHARLAPALGGGAAWARRRGQALDALLARGLPDRRDENWKYLDHARVHGYALGELAGAGADAAALAGRTLPIAGARRIVLVDGRYAPHLSDPVDGTGISIEDLGALLEREPQEALARLRTPGTGADDRFALLADAFASGGVLLRVAAAHEVGVPIYLVHVASAARPAYHQAHVVLDVGPDARIVLVEHFVALGAGAVLGNLAGELTLGAGAEVRHLRLHEHGPETAQVETWAVRAAANSRYEQHFLALGGRLLRSNLRLDLAGASSACRLDGLFVADGQRQVDLLTQVEHRGPATETAQEYRGIASGRGRGSFNGLITVHPGARGSNAAQTSRNLLLSPLAEINARPQLEILVDEVQCRHGATTGSLDEAQLFYLRSRGFDEATARAALTFAFCRSLIERVPLAPVRAAAESLVAAVLPDRDLIGGLA